MTTVPTLAEFEALEKRVRALEARGSREGTEWAPVARSPLGSRKTRRLIAAGKLEASRVGRRLYVRIADVDRFLEARTVEPPKPTPVPVESGDPAEYARRNLHLLGRSGS
jgi:excisionase family DNA binding protein